MDQRFDHPVGESRRREFQRIHSPDSVCNTVVGQPLRALGVPAHALLAWAVACYCLAIADVVDLVAWHQTEQPKVVVGIAVEVSEVVVPGHLFAHALCILLFAVGVAARDDMLSGELQNCRTIRSCLDGI